MFDARLILQGQPADPIGAARSFADLLQTNQAMGLHQAQEQRTLADLTRRQQHEMGLRDLLAKAGASPQQRLGALQADPRYFTEAAGYEDHLANVGAKSATAQKGLAEVIESGRKQLVSALQGTTDDADYQRRLAMFPEHARAFLPQSWAEAKPLVDSLAFSPKERADLEDKATGRAETERHQRSMEGRPGPMMLVAGNGGEQYFADPRKPGAAAVPVTGPSGEQLKKPATGSGAGGGKDWKDLTQAVSTGARGSLAKDLQKSLNSAEALEALLKMPDGTLVNATPQQMREAYTALNGLIAKGGSQALGQIEHMSTDTLAGKIANLKQYITGNPQGQDTPGLVENILDTAKRESQLATKQLRRQQVQGVPNYAHLRGADKKRFDSILKGAGLDPASIDDAGLEISAPREGGGAAHPQDSTAVEWAKTRLRDNPGDEKAKTILKLNGVK